MGSGGGGRGNTYATGIPKSSPVRDRRQLSEPEYRKIKFVDMETQTEHNSIMDMSETDASPSPFVASRELSMCLRDSGRGRSIEDLSQYCSGDDNSDEAASPAGDNIKNAEYVRDEQSTIPSPAVSPNGNNSMSKSDLTYQDACSSPDQLDDAMNSNERLDESSTRRSSRSSNRYHQHHDNDDNLERLGRKVNKFFTENRRSIQSSNSDNGNNHHTTSTLAAQTSTTTGDSNDSMFDVKASRRGFISVNSDTNEVTIIRCASGDEFCNDSWTDEEGDDPDNQYLWRRKR